MEAPFDELKEENESWTTSQEEVLERIAYNSAQMSEEHRQSHYALINSLKWFRVPVIIISSLNSVFSVGLNSYMEQSIVSTVTCLLSLIVSCISSIELFLSIQRRSDAELLSYREFYSLALKINTTLKLDRNERLGDGNAFLQACIAEYNSCFQSAQVNGLGEKDKLVILTIE